MAKPQTKLQATSSRAVSKGNHLVGGKFFHFLSRGCLYHVGFSKRAYRYLSKYQRLTIMVFTTEFRYFHLYSRNVYYWLHRLMHHPKIYRYVHQVHHNSLITSPWTAFSFHPIEGLFEALILPAIILFLPLHPNIIIMQLSIMTLSATINHLDIEIYPKNRLGTWLGSRVIGATHHHLHHKQFKFNFGLYFTFWDRWAKTQSPLFKKTFENRGNQEPF